jgi:hypothetical protein
MTKSRFVGGPGYTVLKEPAVQAVAFFPAVGGGKYHAVYAGGDEAACNGTTPVNGRPVYDPITIPVGERWAHPIICKRCLRLTQHCSPGLKS